MHTDQHPHPFDREEHRRFFARLVDEALHFDDIAEAVAAAPDLNSEQLRTATLQQAAEIAGTAHDEYHAMAAAEDAAAPPAVADEYGETAEGVGAFALTVWVTIIVATISATVFLAAYYLVKVTTHHDDRIAPMRLVGFASLAIALGTAVLAGCAMVLSAGRNQRTPAPDLDVDRAREVWRSAVLERGIVPFMTARLAAAAAAAAAAPEAADDRPTDLPV